MDRIKHCMAQIERSAAHNFHHLLEYKNNSQVTLRYQNAALSPIPYQTVRKKGGKKEKRGQDTCSPYTVHYLNKTIEGKKKRKREQGLSCKEQSNCAYGP